MKKTERLLYVFRHVRSNVTLSRMNEIPEIVVKVVPTENHRAGLGHGNAAGGPAIANEVAELAGVRLRETPITPERVRKAEGKVTASQFGFEEQGNDRD